jgi:hypothetical protein
VLIFAGALNYNGVTLENSFASSKPKWQSRPKSGRNTDVASRRDEAPLVADPRGSVACGF